MTMKPEETNAAKVERLSKADAYLEQRHQRATAAEVAARADMATRMAEGEPCPSDWGQRSAQLTAEIAAVEEAMKVTKAGIRSAKAAMSLAVAKLKSSRREPLLQREKNLRAEMARLEQRLSGRTIEARLTPAEYRQQSDAVDQKLAKVAIDLAQVDREIEAVTAK